MKFTPIYLHLWRGWGVNVIFLFEFMLSISFIQQFVVHFYLTPIRIAKSMSSSIPLIYSVCVRARVCFSLCRFISHNTTDNNDERYLQEQQILETNHIVHKSFFGDVLLRCKIESVWISLWVFLFFFRLNKANDFKRYMRTYSTC